MRIRKDCCVRAKSPKQVLRGAGPGNVRWSTRLMAAASYLFLIDRLDDLFVASFLARVSSLDWMVCALTITRSSPGKRSSISAQREVLCISTPRRSPRISPASLRTLKCCESVDFGIALSLTVRNMEQLCEHSC